MATIIGNWNYSIHEVTLFTVQLPKQTTYLSITESFKDSANLYKTLPPNLIHLIAYFDGSEFTIYENLPKTITHLTVFVCDTPPPIIIFPPLLVFLFLEDYDEISGLPNTIKILELGKYFHSNIKDLPNSLIALKLGKNFDTQLPNLPNSLKELIFIQKNLYWDYSLHILPPLLERLELGARYNKDIDNLPPTLKYLTFGTNTYGNGIFNKQIHNYPTTLTELRFGSQFNQPCIDNLPQSLILLVFGNNFNQPIDNLPKNLKKLQLGENFDKNINNLPDSITHLQFLPYYKYSHWINKLPNSLIYLCLGHAFENELCIMKILPPQIELVYKNYNDQIVINKYHKKAKHYYF